MIVTIDGPAGAGKSSTARMLAERLGFRFLDTGAMYRAVALAALERQLPLDNADAMAELARSLHIEQRDGAWFVDGQDVTHAIRSVEVTANTHYAANNPAVRQRLVELQREAAGNDDLITDGRDQGTVVFPQAECKIFLTASAAERARRRWQELRTKGMEISLEDVLADQLQRDARDENRDVGPLVPAMDAKIVCTDGMRPEEVVDHLEMLVRLRMNQ
jgi:cytidylate kinase